MDLTERLDELVDTLAPETALAIAADDVELHGAPRHARQPPSQAAALLSRPLDAAVDLAIIDSAAALDDTQVVPVLGRLRDLLARRVLVIVRHDAPAAWSRHAMIGCGYTHLAKCEHPTGPVELYEFDIAHYKHTPDWLGPENWANPELWDRYRW